MLVGIPFLPVAPVVLGDLEALETDLFSLLETAQLLVLADGEPELDQDDVVAHQLGFKIIDLAIGAHPVGPGAETLDPLNQHATIPGSIKNRDSFASRNMAPKPPEVRLGALLLGRGGDRNHVVIARVQRAGDAADGAAFASGIVAFEHGDDGEVFELRAARQQGELALVLFQLKLK